MRFRGTQADKFAPLSRAICGTRGKSAYPEPARKSEGRSRISLRSVAPVPHVIDLLNGKTAPRKNTRNFIILFTPPFSVRPVLSVVKGLRPKSPVYTLNTLISERFYLHSLKLAFTKYKSIPAEHAGPPGHLGSICYLRRGFSRIRHSYGSGYGGDTYGRIASTWVWWSSTALPPR